MVVVVVDAAEALVIEEEDKEEEEEIARLRRDSTNNPPTNPSDKHSQECTAERCPKTSPNKIKHPAAARLSRDD